MSCLKKIDARSGCALTNALNIFAVPPTNVAISRSYFREILPLNTISESPYHFRIFSDNLWTDLSRTYVHLELSLEKQKPDGSWAAAESADKVAPIQTIGQTFIEQLRVSVSNTELYDSGPLYAYRNYITTELSYPLSTKETFLASAGYHYEHTQDAADDEGFKKRAALFTGGKTVQLLSRLDFDMGNQELLLLNNTDVMFSLYRAQDRFLVTCLKQGDTTAFRLKLHSIKLYCKMVEVQPSLNLTIYANLEKQAAKYALRKTEVKSCFLTEGRTEFDRNLFNSVIPRRLTMALVSSKAFNGHFAFSPFNFKPFGIRDIAVNAGGMNYPSVAYQNLDFDKGACMRPFVDLYEALGLANSDRNNGLTLDRFRNGWCFFVVPLTSSLDDNCGLELVRNGSTNVRITFNSDSPVPAGGLELIVLAEFDQLVTVDFNRRVVTDISASS
ncbi:Protein F19G12.2 [Aphelenchoides avenae]|nr:Protein F19G12.2 [Aphelenchus avenae]